MKKNELKKQHIIHLGFSLAILFLITFISSRAFFRIDLTSERRYTLSDETKNVLRKLDDVVYIKVYLNGDLPIGFKKLHNGIRETLDEFRVYGRNNIQYEFINPSESNDPKIREKVYADLYQKGLQPINIQARDKEGGASEKIIFPAALITYKGVEIPVSLLSNNVSLTADENLNNSLQTVEYNLIKNIYNLTNKKTDKIAFLEGQGELDEIATGDITRELSNYFSVDRGAINGKPGVLDGYKAIIVAKPSKPFTEQDKLVLDQYLMKGGKILWFVSEVNVNTDSLGKGSTIGFINNLNIDDLLFTYGVRINPNLVQDVQCNMLPINTATPGSQPSWTPTPWLYYPLLSPIVEHPVTRNLNIIWARFASQIDTVGSNPKVKKTALLKTSTYTRLVNAPLAISLSEVKQTPVRKEFTKSNQAIAILLEGRFSSLYRNRLVRSIIPEAEASYKPESVPTRMIVVADGNMIGNDVRMTAKGPMVSALGYDKYTRQTFGNKDFIVNAVNYLTDEAGLMSLRSKEFKLRILDKSRIADERLKWQLINTLGPAVLIIILGLFYNFRRKKKYASTK
ncbi:MAG: gliding motility-associated ABC transporter substrate-binding protein GldG [Bacteroidota bacterium]|nr:gliding motility-associated ABC transporter substrate-binding protein GldG [Bacteroidota bacterium]